MLRVILGFIYRDDPIAVGTILPKTTFHEEHVWQGLVASGHLEEWDEEDAGEFSDDRSGEDPQD